MVNLILFNHGGRHIKVIKDIISAQPNINLKAVIDPTLKESLIKDNIHYSNGGLLQQLKLTDEKFFISIGSNKVRKHTYEKNNIPIERYQSLIHPSAVISKSAKIGYGTVVMPNVVINADTVIGNHCIINTSSTVEHDCIVKDYAHISPGVTLPGGVTVGEGAHIGTGASAIPEVTIGDWSIIGAGAVIVHHTKSHTTAVGVPAQTIKNNMKTN